jgi:hypothetical protein
MIPKHLILKWFLCGLFALTTDGTALAKPNPSRVYARFAKMFGGGGDHATTKLATRFGDDALPHLERLFEHVGPEDVGFFELVAENVSPSQLSGFADQAAKFTDAAKVLTEPNAIRLIADRPYLADGIVPALRTFPGKQTTVLAQSLAETLPGQGSIVTDLLPVLSDKELEAFCRMWNGKTYSSEAINQVILKAGKQLTQPRLIGDLTEELATRAINSGRMVPKAGDLGLRKGSIVIPGQYDRIHGIDRIGVSPEGKPVILELTCADKNFASQQLLDGDGLRQMSPEWVLDRWRKFLELPDSRQLLVDLGIKPHFLEANRLSPDFVTKNFVRKVLVPFESEPKNLPAAGLNPLNGLVKF